MKKQQKKQGLRMIRQGDVLVVTTDLPANAKPAQAAVEGHRVILAHGELTGHAHAIAREDVTEFTAENAGIVARFLQTTSLKALRHEEHARLPVPPGAHRVIQQREYSQRQPRPVAD